MIIGLDIGTWSIKAVAMDPRRKYQIVAIDEERILEPQAAAPPEESVGAPPSPEDAPPPGPPPTPIQDAAEEPGWAAPEEDTGDWKSPGYEAAADDAPDGPTQMGEPGAPDAEIAPAPPADKDAPAPWLAAIERLLARMPEADLVITAMPWGKSLTIQIPGLPFENKSKVERIIPGLLSDRLPMSLDEVTYDFQIQSRDGEDGEHEAIVGFARSSDIAHLLGQLDEARVNPAVLGVPELILRYTAEAYLPAVREKTVALLDMGHRTTSVLVLEHGHVALARAISYGGADVTDEICEAFADATPEDAARVKHAQGAILEESQAQDPSQRALSEAIQRALMPMMRDLRRTFQSLYARERVEIETIYVLGGASRIGGLQSWLSAEFGGVPVERFGLEDPAHELPLVADDVLSRSGMALGLAHQQARDRMLQRSVDLRQGPFVYRGKSSYLRGQLMRLAAAAAFLLVLLGVALLMQKRDLDAQRDAMRQAVAEETREVFGAPLYRAQDIRDRVEVQGDGEESFVPKMSAYEVFYELTSKLSQDTELELRRIEVDADRNLIQVYGRTTTPVAVDQIVNEFKQLQCIKSIKKDKLRVRNDDEVDFELQIASACS